MSSRCRLLELPAELRIRVYEFVLTCEGVVTANCDAEKMRDNNLTALAMTCKQINSECKGLFAKFNDFTFNVPIFEKLDPNHSQSASRLMRKMVERFDDLVLKRDLRSAPKTVHIHLGHQDHLEEFTTETPREFAARLDRAFDLITPTVQILQWFELHVRISFTFSMHLEEERASSYDFWLTGLTQAKADIDRSIDLGPRGDPVLDARRHI